VLTVPSLAIAFVLLAAVLLSGWLMLRSRLVADLDHEMVQRGWVPVAHALLRLSTLALRSRVLPEQRREVVAAAAPRPSTSATQVRVSWPTRSEREQKTEKMRTWGTD
jgi:ABC-type uncharacterized transport system involved in gliding motility auxiliary subunit